MYVSTAHSGSPRPDGPSHVRAESSPSTSSSHGSPPGRFISGAQLHMTSSYAHAHGLHGTPNSGSVEHRGVFTHPHVADISPGPACPSSPTADRLPTAAAMEEAARIVMSCAEWLLSQLYLLESEPRRQRQDAEDGGEDGSMCEAADGFARAAEDPAATDFPAPSSCTAPPMPELLYRFTMQPTDSDESATRTATTSSAIAEPAELSNVFETFFFPTELARYCRDATTTAASRPSPDRRSSDGTSHPHHTRRGEELTHSSGNTAAEPPVEMELRETFRAFLRYAQYCLHLALAPAHAEHLCEVAHPRQASPTHSSSSQPTMEEAAGRLAGGASHETWTTSSKIRCPPPHAMLRGSTMSSPCVPSVTSTPTISPTQAYLCNDETLPSGCYLGAASGAAAGANAPAPPPLRTTAKMIVQMLLSLAFSCPCEALASAAKLVLAEGLARLGCPSSGDYGLAAGLDCLANYSTEEEEDEDDGFMEGSTEVAEQMVDGGAFAATRRLRLWFECDGSFQLLTSAQLRARRREDAQPRKDGHVSVLLRYQPPPSPLFPALQRFTMDGGVAADAELLRAAMEGASRGDGTCGVRSQPRSPLNRGGSLSYVRQGSMRQPPSGVAGISALQLRGEEAGTTSEDDRSARTSSSPAAAEKARALHLLLAVRRSHVLPSRAERRLTKTMTYNIFVELTECPNYLHLLGLSPRYLEAHYAALRYSLLGDGPLPVDMRLMIAVMVGARFPCEAVVTRSAALMCRFSEAAGLEDGEVEVHGEGEPVDGNGGSSRAVRWLLHGPPPKLVAAQSFIARATHNPWMVQPEEVRELLLHGWTVPELFQLITLIATIAPLCGLALGLSVPMEPCMRATLPPEMLAGMAAARGSSADLVDLPGPAQSNPRGWYSLYTGSDNITTTQRVHKRDGAERSTHTLWRGNFSWSDSGAYLMEQYYPGAAQRISEEMEVFTEEMQRLTEADCAGLSQPGVSPAFAMRSLYLYVQNLLGFQVEDYSYNEINRVLQRSPKLLAHMMTMRPQDFGAAVQSSLSGMRSFPQSASQITLGCPASPRGVDDGCSSPLSADSSNGVRRQLLREANGREERERSLLQTLGIANGSAMAMAMAGSSPALTDHTDLEEEEDVAKHAAAWRAVAEATLDLQQERMILLVALSTMVARKEGLLHILLYALCELVNNM